MDDAAAAVGDRDARVGGRAVVGAHVVGANVVGAYVAAFLVVAVVKAFLHEPWRDELADWGAALDAPDFVSFAAWVRTTTHGLPQAAAAFALQRAVGDVRALLLLHAALATFAVHVVLRHAPFPMLHRVLFTLGLLPFFEWGVLARPYGVTLAAAVVACTLAARASARPLAAGAALAVLAQTNAYGILLAAAIGAGVAVLVLRERGSAARAEIAGAALLVAASAATTIWFSLPDPGGWQSGAWRWDLRPERVRETLGGLAETFLPFRAPWIHLRTGAWWLLAPVVLGVITWALRRRPAALTVWLVATAGLVTFGHVAHAGAARHRGHLFVAFVAACWIAAIEARRRGSAGAAGAAPEDDERPRRVVALVLLAAQVPAGLERAARDVAGPYSAASAAADALRELRLDTLPIVADPEHPTAPVGALLGRPLHFPATGRTSATASFDRLAPGALADDVLTGAARDLAARRASDVVLLVGRPLPEAAAPGPPVRIVPAGMVPDEAYWIYVVPRP